MTHQVTDFTPLEVSVYYRARLPQLMQNRGSEWRGACPIHTGKGANFTVHAATGQWHCHSACQRGGKLLDLEQVLSGRNFSACKAEVLRLLGRARAEFPDGKESLSASNLKEIERYCYVDHESRPLFEVVRYEASNGLKRFKQSRRNSAGHEVWNLKGVERVPYRLPKLLAAETVYLVEGEKDVHTLEEMGLVASCNPGGCGGGRLFERWSHFFRNRKIVILPDNDEAGRRHAATVAAALLGVAASLRILELPNLQPKGDISDWRAAGGTIERFHEMTQSAAITTPAVLASLRSQWSLEVDNETSLPWPTWEAIESELPSVQAFSEDLLPEAFRALAADVAERMQVPIDYPAVVMVLSLAGVVNRRAVIQPKANDTEWVVVPNLWGGIIAPPGFMKSPVIQAATRPLDQIQTEWRLAHEDAMRSHAHAEEEFELRRSGWKEQYKKNAKKGNALPPRPDGKPEKPRLRRLIVNDSTFEALHEIMCENPAGILVVRDELTGWWSQLDRSGREGERAFSLQAWNGDTGHTIDRIGRGTIHVAACCMSMLGGIQPGRLRSYLVDALEDGPSNDGLIQRFQILVWPDTPSAWTYVDRLPDEASEQQAARVFRKLVEVDADDPMRFRFTPEAQNLFEDWLGKLEVKIRGDELHPALVSHLSKYRSLMPSLALLFALSDWAVGGDITETVSLAHAKRAAAFCDYLESHARRVYSCIVTPQLRAARELASKIKARKLGKDGLFSGREVYLKGWSGLDTPEAFRGAAEVLQEAGWIREVMGKSGALGGRPTRNYQVNPKIMRGSEFHRGKWSD